MPTTFACELEPGDVIFAGQTFKVHSASSFAPTDITLERDYVVLREPTAALPDWRGTEWVEIVAAPRANRRAITCLAAPRGRVVRSN